VAFSDEQWAAVEALTRGMMNKFLHPAIQAVKAAAAEGDGAKLEMLRSTFDRQRATAYSAVHALPKVPESQETSSGGEASADADAEKDV
jgi:glutamyl-tRNA reductase